MNAADLRAVCARPGCGGRFYARDVRQRFCTSACSNAYKPVGSQFIGVDGEGIGNGRDHRYVLLGVGDRQQEWPEGCTDITELFDFLYACFLDNPHGIFAGYFLGYDFNMWFRLLPRERAAMLISPAGIAKRARKSPEGQRLGPFPVEYKDWEFDILANKRFKLKPKDGKQWMYICDAGPFFQTSLLTAINPRKWSEPIVTDEEYELIKTGKERRDSASLDDDMRFYNRLENDVFARLMTHLQTGLSHASVSLKKQQWFGPGQAAQAWLRLSNKMKPTMDALIKYKSELKNAAIASYYGGWFEIPVHGHIPGETYEYDINSAYPAIASKLPCLCGKWRFQRGTPRSKPASLRLVNIIARGRDTYLGGLSYRRADGRVLRPRYTEGWYWHHEVESARKAGLIGEVTYLEFWDYYPCSHEPPLKQLEGLYESRLRIGKDTPEGKAFKLVYNSVYGKFAQSEGEPVFANPFYASLITAGCRAQIMDAIATHPDRSAAVVMVATDGVYFTSPHPGLDAQISERLGEWSKESHSNLCVFKPGVYWDDKARKAIADGEAPEFKSRGVNARDFGQSIGAVDSLFSAWGKEWLPGMPPGRKDWPSVSFHARFTQISVRQALSWTDEIPDKAKQIAVYKNLAGVVQNGKKLVQDSWPEVKRNPQSVYLDGSLWRSLPWDGGPHWPPSLPYEKRFGVDDDTGGFAGYSSPDGPSLLSFRQALGVG